MRVDLEHVTGERRLVEIAAGVLAVLGCLARRFDGVPLPPGAAGPRPNEWAAPVTRRLDPDDLAALAALVRAVQAIGWERTGERLRRRCTRGQERTGRGRS